MPRYNTRAMFPPAQHHQVAPDWDFRAFQRTIHTNLGATEAIRFDLPRLTGSEPFGAGLEATFYVREREWVEIVPHPDDVIADVTTVNRRGVRSRTRGAWVTLRSMEPGVWYVFEGRRRWRNFAP